MKNFIQPGEIVTLPAPYDRLAGQGALVGNIFGVSASDVLSGVDSEFAVCGVYRLAKTSAQAWTVGAKIYWDNSGKVATTVATGNTLIGTAIEVAANPSSTGVVRLNEATVNDVANAPLSVTMVAAAGTTNVAEVTVTVKDTAGNTIAAVHNLDLWLSDDTDGEGLTGTTASGAVAAKASSGTDLVVMVAKKAVRVQTKKTGIYVLSITDSAKTAFKVCASINGKTTVGATLITGNYG